MSNCKISFGNNWFISFYIFSISKCFSIYWRRRLILNNCSGRLLGLLRLILSLLLGDWKTTSSSLKRKLKYISLTCLGHFLFIQFKFDLFFSSILLFHYIDLLSLISWFCLNWWMSLYFMFILWIILWLHTI